MSTPDRSAASVTLDTIRERLREILRNNRCAVTADGCSRCQTRAEVYRIFDDLRDLESS
jgi:hypothetical protein